MKKFFSGVLYLMTVCVATTMFTACGDKDSNEEVETGSPESTAVIIIPQHSDALKYMEYTVTVTCDDGVAYSKTFSSVSFVSKSSLSTKGQSIASSMQYSDDVKYFEAKDISIPKGSEDVVISVAANTNSTTASSSETVNYTSGIGYEIKPVNSTSATQTKSSVDIKTQNFSTYSNFVLLIKEGYFDYSKTITY